MAEIIVNGQLSRKKSGKSPSPCDRDLQTFDQIQCTLVLKIPH